ncbi:MAG: O-antigen ligase family protein [Pyrinomonadaceae bacterium]
MRFELSSTLSRQVAAFVAVFALWGLISGAWASSFAAVTHHTLLWTEYALFFVLASEILRRHGRAFLLTTFVWFVVMIGLVTLSDYVTMPDFKTLEGTLRMRYSAYGELLVTILPLLWLAAVYRRRRMSWLIALSPAALGWTAAMLSLSKGVFIAGIVGTICSFVAAGIFGNRVHRTRLMATAGIWLLVTVAVQVGFSVLTPIPATVDYISGKADPTRETSVARVFIWRTAEPLVRLHWLTGVGADNFGIAANEGRAEFRATHPGDTTDEINADFMLERAHNEPLQVLAELGVPGLILFAIPFLLLAWATGRAILIRKQRPSLLFWAATGGMVAFAMSSMVSSFSFRIAPNGIAFFLVFAVAVHELSRTNRGPSMQNVLALPKAAVAVALLILISVFGAKAWAEYSFADGDTSADRSTAASLFSRAVALDPDYASAHYRLSNTSFQNGDYNNAAAELQRAIDGGMGVVLTYSSLADCYQKAGDQTAEFRTFEKALSIFPRSVFLRVRYGIELDKAQRPADAKAQLSFARAIDAKQANGWYSLITLGSVRSFYKARNDETMAPPVDLKPDVAVLQYLDRSPAQ